MKTTILAIKSVQSKIFTIRGVQVMIDYDLAELYQVETKVLNQAVTRNIARFPEKFRFQLSQKEYDEYERSLRSQIVTSKSGRGGRRYLPYVFTEQGVSMLSAVLKSETAVTISIQIMDAFVEMRKFISNNAILFQEIKQIKDVLKSHDSKFDQVFKAIESRNLKPSEGIFFDGQIYDAYTFASDLVRSAKSSIIIIDNYVDDTVLTLLNKRIKGCSATIYTQKISKELHLDLKKHNEQYPSIEIKLLKKSHDRFLIIDENTLYHIGASLKDLGKKWFAFSKFKNGAKEMLTMLEKRLIL